MLSYANSMLNPLLYAAFNENFRVGFARACRCVTGGGDGNLATNTRGGGQSTAGRTATDHNRLRPTTSQRLTTSHDDRKSVAGQRIEVVQVETVVGGRPATAFKDLVAINEAKPGENECDALVAESGSISAVDVANPTVNTTDHSVQETVMWRSHISRMDHASSSTVSEKENNSILYITSSNVLL